jgi:hypothetical protein
MFVVPAGTPTDNVTLFGSLQDVFVRGTLHSGDTIQIEPGSLPGNLLTYGAPPALNNITIQGDPAAGLSAIPMFTLGDAVTFGPNSSGWTFRNVNIGLIDTGAVTFNTNVTYTNDKIEDLNSTSTSPFTFSGTADRLLDSTLVSAQASGYFLTVNLNGAPTQNLISGNTFVSRASGGLINYHVNAATSSSDQVVDDTFLYLPAANLDSFAIAVDAGRPLNGLTFQGNTITEQGTNPASHAGILIACGDSGTYNFRIVDNVISLHSSNASVNVGGIGLVGGNSGSTVTATITGNRVQTGTTATGASYDAGLALEPQAGVLDAIVQGNDFHGNGIGVLIYNGGGSASGIDLGGGSQGSRGGNDFRSFTGTATSSAGAIVTQSGTTGILSAEHNIFSVVTPSAVTYQGGASIPSSINTTNLTGNAAFVETLYNDFLHRAGDTTNSNDAGAWVAALNNRSLSAAQVANDIVHSAESLGDLVDGLYLKILGRTADAGGRADFVNLLGRGWTLEQVETSLFSSEEYNGLIGSDAAFTRSLYNRVMGRVGSSAEVSGWLNLLSSEGRAAVASAFLSSAEARGVAVEQLYGALPAQLASTAAVLPNLLHRTTPPTAGEIANWVNSNFDLLMLQAVLASSAEFVNNG